MKQRGKCSKDHGWLDTDCRWTKTEYAPWCPVCLLLEQEGIYEKALARIWALLDDNLCELGVALEYRAQFALQIADESSTAAGWEGDCVSEQQYKDDELAAAMLGGDVEALKAQIAVLREKIVELEAAKS